MCQPETLRACGLSEVARGAEAKPETQLDPDVDAI